MQLFHISLTNFHEIWNFFFLEKSIIVQNLRTLLQVTLANDQLDAQIFNTFITILYMYMFRGISCSSSGGQICINTASSIVTLSK